MTKPSSSSSPLTLSQARVLLNILHYKPPPSPGYIQQSFREAARIYHPDSRHRPDARPCSTTFRRCHEARKVLMEHYHGTGNGFGSDGFSRRTPNKAASTSFRPRGFPYRTLRVLTVKQNFMLRGSVMLILTFGTLYEELTKEKKKTDM